MENKYSIDVEHINPMETAPVWDYYNGDVEVICLFFKHDVTEQVVNTFGFYDREQGCWLDYYSESPIYEEKIGWLPDYQYVGIN